MEAQNLQNDIIGLLQDIIGTVMTDVDLRDEYGGKTLRILNEEPSTLVLTLANVGKKPINIAKLSGTPSATNYDLSIEFPVNSLSFKQALKVRSPAGWDVALDQTGKNIFLTTEQDVILQPTETLEIVLSYIYAETQDKTATHVASRIHLSNHITSDNVPLLGSQDNVLLVTAGEEQPMPLRASIIGKPTIINDGVTGQYITVRVANPSLEPVGLQSSSVIQIEANVDPSTGYALYDPGRVSGVNLEILGANAKHWNPTSSSDSGLWTATPDSSLTSIDYGEIIDLKIGPITSTQAPGLTTLEVSFFDFKIYGSHSEAVQVEKTPLVYKPEKGAGMLLYGTGGDNQALAIQGDASEPLLSVTQQSNVGSGLAITVPATSANVASGIQVGPSLNANSPLSIDNNTVSVNTWININDAQTDLTKSHTNLNLHNDDTSNGNSAQLTFSSRDLQNNHNVFSAGIAAVFGQRSATTPGAPADLVFMTSDVNGVPIETARLVGGRLGIGTTTPAQALDVNGDIQCSSLHPATIAFANGINIDATTAGIFSNTNTGAPADLIFKTSDANGAPIEAARLVGTNLGIGTPAPTQALEVAGNVKCGTLMVDAITFSNGITLDVKTASILSDLQNNSLAIALKNTNYDGGREEYLYAADITYTYGGDDDRRMVFTWVPGGQQGGQSNWTMELVKYPSED